MCGWMARERVLRDVECLGELVVQCGEVWVAGCTPVLGRGWRRRPDLLRLVVCRVVRCRLGLRRVWHLFGLVGSKRVALRRRDALGGGCSGWPFRCSPQRRLQAKARRCVDVGRARKARGATAESCT